ncbi:MAG: fused MFS/spermidine synthase [Myxococcota bacterium]
MLSLALCLVFFLSGVAALLFENLWFYQAGITLGNSVWASSLVLAGFMGGLALGNAIAARVGRRIVRAVRAYALLEVIIGLTGLALVVGLPSLTPVLSASFGPLLEAPWLLNPLRLVCAFALLLIPSTAMGATLPLMVSALYRHDPRFGAVLGRLYGWNTLGAVVGALAGEIVLVEALGVLGTGGLAAALDFAVAAIALALSRRTESTDTRRTHERPARPAPLGARARRLLVAAGLAGFTLLALEVVWFRFLLHFLFGSSETFAILLAVVLVGIGLGGLAGGRIAARPGRSARVLPGLALATGLVCLLLYLLFPSGPRVATWSETAGRAGVLMFPVSLLSGVLFTLLGDAIKHEEPDETRAAGLLTLSNTLGAMLGPLVAGFVLLPGLGMDRSVQALAAIYAGIAALAWWASARPAGALGKGLSVAAAAALALAVVFFPAGATWQRHLQPTIALYTQSGNERPVAMREGVTETIVYLRESAFGHPVAHRMLTNGYSMSGTNTYAQRYMKLFVYLPLALAPDARSAVLISYGVGSTAKALTDSRRLETIDMVDISRDVIEMNDIVYPDPQEIPTGDPRVRVHIEDGRYFLQTTRRRFDLITGEPPPPKIAGVVSLYTQEYFSLVRERLNDGGLTSYWLPVHSLTPDDTRSIIRAFCNAFEDCSLWGGSGLDWILLGSRGGAEEPAPSRLSAQWDDPLVGPEMAALGLERPEQLGALYMAGPDELAEIAGDAPPLTDAWPKRLSDRTLPIEEMAPTYVQWMRTDVARERFRASPWIRATWPAALRESTLSYFDIQALLNRTLLQRPPPLGRALPAVHELGADWQLATPSLWLLGTSAARQRAAQAAAAEGREGARVLVELALGALAERRYAEAASLLGRAEEKGARSPRWRSLEIYCLYMSGDREGAELALASAPAAPGRGSARPWLRQLLAAPER